MIFIQLAVFHFLKKSQKLSQVLKLKNMNEKRFVHHDTLVEDFVKSLKANKTKEKTKRDVKLRETFLKNEKSDELECKTYSPQKFKLML